MKHLALCALLSINAAQAAPLPPAASCRAVSAAAPPTVVELYTSEGCSSCPPADRWLSTLKARPDVLALAFHVDYWDKLGWTDRFATPAATARQYAVAQHAGQSGVYTPQVMVAGADWRDWPALPGPAAARAAPVLTLQRDGGTVSARIDASPGATTRLAGYWAVLEDRHTSRVRAGENAGATLAHDHVVRLYKPVSAWAAADGAQLQLQVSRGVPEFPRRVVFVVTDAAGATPLQALALGC